MWFLCWYIHTVVDMCTWYFILWCFWRSEDFVHNEYQFSWNHKRGIEKDLLSCFFRNWYDICLSSTESYWVNIVCLFTKSRKYWSEVGVVNFFSFTSFFSFPTSSYDKVSANTASSVPKTSKVQSGQRVVKKVLST